MSNYTKKDDLKNEASIDASNLAGTKQTKLDVDKLKNVNVNLSKLSNTV